MQHIKICSIDEEGRYGGPEKRIIQISKSLREYHVETHIIFPKLDSERFNKEIQKENLKSFRIDITRLTLEPKYLFKYLIRFFFEIKILYKHLKQNKYDLIQVNGTPQFKGAIAGKIARTPVLWVLEDTHMPLPIRVLFHLIAKLCADTIVCVGQKVSNQYIKGRLINKKHYEIHAPVNTNIFDPKNVIGKNYIKSTNTIKIGIVAGISKVKGIEYFINMGETICKQYNDIEFFIAGGSLNSQNRYNNKIKSLVDKTKYSKRFHFLGFVEDIPKFLKSMDICVFTSITEASPTAIWEALSMEKPVVTTDVGSVRQYIVDGVSGFVVPTGDVISLSSKVSFFIENKEIAEKIGKAGRTVAIESLDVSVAAKNYYKAYRDTIDTKN